MKVLMEFPPVPSLSAFPHLDVVPELVLGIPESISASKFHFGPRASTVSRRFHCSPGGFLRTGLHLSKPFFSSPPGARQTMHFFPCEGSGDFVGVLTLLVRGIAQAFHDDRVVEVDGSFPMPTISKNSLYTLFCSLILDHGVL